MLGGPLGAVFGAAFGHNFDKGLGSFAAGTAFTGDVERIQTAFFTTTFSMMGHIAKADGQVSQDRDLCRRRPDASDASESRAEKGCSTFIQ